MTAEIIPLAPPLIIEERCSFCDAAKTSTKALIGSGNGHYICDACVRLAKQRMAPKETA